MQCSTGVCILTTPQVTPHHQRLVTSLYLVSNSDSLRFGPDVYYKAHEMSVYVYENVIPRFIPVKIAFSNPSGPYKTVSGVSHYISLSGLAIEYTFILLHGGRYK